MKPCLARTVALFAAVAFADEPKTYYLSASDAGFSGYYKNAAKWVDAGGNAAGAEGAALPASDIFVVRDGRTLRTCDSVASASFATTFTCKRIVFGDADAGTAGTFLCYAQGEAHVNFSPDPAQDGAYFDKGYVSGQMGSGRVGTINGKITVTSSAADPFAVISAYDGYILDFTGPISATTGTGLRIGGTDSANARRNATNFTVRLTGDLSGFKGTITVKPSCNNFAANPTYLTTLTLSGAGGLPSGNLALEPGSALTVPGSENTVGCTDLSIGDGVSLTLAMANVKEGDGVTRPHCAKIAMSGDLSVAGTVRVALDSNEDIPANGETNRLAILVAAKGGIDKTRFALADGGAYFLGFDVVIDAETGAETLYAEFAPVVKLVMSDPDAKDLSGTRIYRSAVTNAASWSDGKVPHAGAHYIVANDATVSGRSQRDKVPITVLRVEGTDAAYRFPGESLTIGDGCCLITFCTGFSVPRLRLLDGSTAWCGQQRSTTISNTVLEAESGTVRVGAYTGYTLMHDGTLSGSAQIVCGTVTLTSQPYGNYRFFGDNSSFAGTFTVTQVVAGASFTEKFSTFYVKPGCSLGGNLETFDPRALVLSRYSVLRTQDGNVSIPTGTNRGLCADGVGRIYTDGKFSLGMPLTIDGSLYKEGTGTLQLDADAAGAGENGGTLVVTNGTLAVHSAGAVDGFTVAFAPGTALSLKVDLADETLTRYGIRNVKTAAPFALGAGMTALPLSVDTSASPVLPEKGVTVGVLTVADSATNSLESVFSVSRFYSGCRFKPVKLHDDENGWTTYAARYAPSGMAISFR